ncbi:hypothetical protein [Mesorhizobium loti]|jgi:hypothetical protein|uniref:hypothetical protein n=1 Tax=Rhizobium loti TaxID=381 RepID=UPI0011B81995|nr:hypothetical protein [Mesorhizobium loti]
MQLEAFTGGFLGDPGMRGRIDTRLFKDNVFYREKTVLRQLFFRWGVPHVLGVPESDFAFQGHGNVILRFKPAAASDGVQRVRNVEEQQRLQGCL